MLNCTVVLNLLDQCESESACSTYIYIYKPPTFFWVELFLISAQMTHKDMKARTSVTEDELSPEYGAHV